MFRRRCHLCLALVEKRHRSSGSCFPHARDSGRPDGGTSWHGKSLRKALYNGGHSCTIVKNKNIGIWETEVWLLLMLPQPGFELFESVLVSRNCDTSRSEELVPADGSVQFEICPGIHDHTTAHYIGKKSIF
jgi:hypothetical protein